ncbi:MAG: restriction endonuclease [Mucilaginibacter sp.]|nr:restriction endonuclease [Mucilaginibacter sp.]
MPPTQVQSGKAFEYALIIEAQTILSASVNVNIVIDSNYTNCLNCFNVHTTRQQTRYSAAAIAAINHIISLEPRLTNSQNTLDTLTLQLQSDSLGRNGDVRDILFIRSTQNWEIGISAKNNHKALKHSRLSIIKDFGASWVGVPCSQIYFNSIRPVFTQLLTLKHSGALWRHLANKHANYYQPVLTAFRNELDLINRNNVNIPQSLVAYIIGRNDFYKVMKRARVVEIIAFNLHGNLGRSINGVRGVTSIPRLNLPTQIVQFQMMAGKTDTLSMICNQGWQLSFRIHSAESLVIPSLKFDINLIGHPNSMYSHHLPY